LSRDFDPETWLEKPQEGGCPDGALTFDEDGSCISYMMTVNMGYARGKLADVTVAHRLAKKKPSINSTSQQPGSIASNFGNSLGIFGTIYYCGFYLFQFSPSQGARAALRAALDPDFNTVEALQGRAPICTPMATHGLKTI
jgi:hypothetical protein